MPSNIVKTPGQKALWDKAKMIAQKNGQPENYAYIMGIYKKMGGLQKGAADRNEMTEKLAAGFVGKVLGRNVKRVQKEMDDVSQGIEWASKKLKNLKTEQNLKGRMGKVKFNYSKTTPKYSDAEIKSKLKPDYDKLKELNKIKSSEKRKTFGARAKLVGGTGLVGVTAATLNKRKDSAGNQYQQSMMPIYANEHAELIEKIANDIVKEAAPLNITFNEGGNIFKRIKDVATMQRSRNASKVLKALKTEGASFPADAELQNLKNIIDKSKTLQGRNAKIQKRIDRLNNFAGTGTLNEKLDKAVYGKFDGRDTSNIKKRINNLKGEAGRNSNIINEARKVIDRDMTHIVNQRDNELAKSLGLYAGTAGGVGYGIHKARERKNRKA